MMDNVVLAIDGAWKVLAIGLLLGAGLPVLFALGVRSMAYGVGVGADDEPGQAHPIGKVIAIACFALVVLGVLLGIGAIVASGFDLDLTSIVS